MKRASGWARATVLSASVTVLLGPGAVAQVATATRPIETYWIPDGPVYSVYNQGTNVYFGGQFRVVAPPNGAFSPVNASTGQPVGGFPRVEGGSVYAAIPDGAGGWFIGGTFTSVAGVARPGRARILGDGRVAAWTPAAAPNAAVRALARKDDYLFVGGVFTALGGGTGPNYLGAFSVVDGSLQIWDPKIATTAGGGVYALLLGGTRLYAGGRFTTVNGSGRCGAVAVAPGSAALDPSWNPALGLSAGCGEVYALAPTLGGKIVAGGKFDQAGANVNVEHLAELDPTSGAETGVDHQIDSAGEVRALALSANDGRVYVGGIFATVDAVAHPNLVALNNAGGLETWNPAADGKVLALGMDDVAKVLYVGGSFHALSAATRHYAAALNTSSFPPSVAATFIPNPNGDAEAFALSGGNLGVGGSFSGIGGSEHVNAASVEASAGVLDDAWAPKITPVNSTVWEVGPHLGGATPTVLLGGDFDQVNGVPRRALASVRATDGSTVAGFVPPLGGTDVVRAFMHDTNAAGGKVYVGGTIANLCGGSPCPNLVKLDGDTGVLAPGWSSGANAGAPIEALWASTTRVVVGGSFTTIGGANRTAVAELSPTVGTALAINAGLSTTPVYAVLPGVANEIYFGGNFNQVLGGPLRNYAAAVFYNGTSTVAQPWNPSPGSLVFAITPGPGSDLYIGGAFGAPTSRIARVDGGSGASTGWTPQAANGIVHALGRGFSILAAGGTFTSVGTDRRQGLVAFCENSAPPSIGAVANGDNSVKVSWSSQPGVVYRVFRALGPVGGFIPLSPLVNGDGSVVSFVDNAVEGANTNYRYLVRVEQGSPAPCLSDPSNIVSVSTTGTCNLPPRFDGAALAVPNTIESFCGARVFWQAANPSCGWASIPAYSIYRDVSPGFIPSPDNRLAANKTGTDYKDFDDVVAGQKYYYVVRATDPSNGEQEPNQVYAEVTIPAGCGGVQTAPARVPVATVKAWTTGGANSGHAEVTWLTPPTGGGDSQFCMLACPSGPMNPGGCVPPGGIGTGTICGPAANTAVSRTETGLVAGTGRTYTVFRQFAGGPFTQAVATGRPDGDPPDESWAFGTWQSALGTPALYPGVSYVAVSNDRRVYGMTPGAAGGSWPAGFIPPAMNEPSQSGATFLPTTAALGSPALIISSTDGRVYAFSASNGASLWSITPVLAPSLIAKPSVMFAEAYPGAGNLVFIGTRDSTGPNQLKVLSLGTGTPAWSFPTLASVPGGTGVIHAPALVDYAGGRVYFGTRRRVGGSSNTLWCVVISSQTGCGNWGTVGGIDVGEIDVPLSLRNGRLYYLTTGGVLGSVDVANPANPLHTFTVGGNPKGMWTYDAGSAHVRAIVSTGTRLRLIDDDTATAGSMNAVSPFDNTPAGTALSAPVLGPGPAYHVWVGDGSGQLRGFLLSDGSPAGARTLGATSATIGTPRRDVNTGMLIVGGSDGVVYAVPEF